MGLIVTDSDGGVFKVIFERSQYKYTVWDTEDLSAECVGGDEIYRAYRLGIPFDNVNINSVGTLVAVGIISEYRGNIFFNEDAVVLFRTPKLYVYCGGRLFEFFLYVYEAIGFKLDSYSFTLRNVKIETSRYGLENCGVYINRDYTFYFSGMDAIFLGIGGNGFVYEGKPCTKMEFMRSMVM